MSPRIRRVQVRDRSLDPAQAELWVAVEAEHVGPAAELRGRLTGPRCLYAATVEVAYPLRPLPQRLTGRVVIPEPCLWEPQCPFLYHGTIELWQDGVCCDQVEVRHGLRRVLLGPHGLRVNGRRLTLHGRAVSACDETEAAALRRADVNLLVAPAEADVWDPADLYGFFVLGRLREPDEATLLLAERRADHPSCFGWLLEAPFERWRGEPVRRLRGAGVPVGVEGAGKPPEGIDFIACPLEAASGLQALGLPVLLTGAGPEAAGVFGRVV